MKRGSSLLSETKRDFLPTLYKSGRPHAAVKPEHIVYRRPHPETSPEIIDLRRSAESVVLYKRSYKLDLLPCWRPKMRVLLVFLTVLALRGKNFEHITFCLALNKICFPHV